MFASILYNSGEEKDKNRLCIFSKIINLKLRAFEIK